jgi:hypothetical protein
MCARDWHWYRVCQRTFPTIHAELTAAEVLERAGYGHGDQFRLEERGRQFKPGEKLQVNGREFYVIFGGEPQ